MSARENVMVGQHARMSGGLVGSIVRTPKVHAEEKRIYAKAGEMLKELIGLCTGGNSTRRQSTSPTVMSERIEIAPALASDPLLLLLDEPTAGMNPQESDSLTQFIQHLRDERGLTVLLIEHDMKVVMNVSERIAVPTTARRSPRAAIRRAERKTQFVVEAYLGKQG